MRLGRHFFTASRKKGGFFTLAKTQDLGEEFLETKVLNKGFLSYSKPSNIEEPQSLQDLDKFPVSYRFFVIDGSRLYSVIHYTGQSNHTPRFGNYFADTVIVNNVDETDVKNAIPFNIFTSENISWRKRVIIEEEKEIPEYLEQLEVHFEKNQQQLTLDKMISQLSSQNFKEHLTTLSLLLETILEEALKRPRKKIIIYGSEPEVRNWILIATALFPPQFINVISFTTYFENPTYSPFFINGLVPAGNITPALFEKNDEKYRVVLLDKLSQVDSAYDNEYIQLICALIEQKNIKGITELLNEADYDLFKVTQLDRSINRVAKFHIILNKIIPDNINFKEIFNEFEELQFSLLEKDVDITPKETILFKKAANINPPALDEFFKSKLQISTIQDALKTITIQYRDFYLCYLKPENSEDVDTLNYPLQFLKYSLEQAKGNLEPLDFSKLCLDLFSALEKHLDQINSDVLKQMGVAAVKLLEPELPNVTEQLAILDQLRLLNLKHKLDLNLEPEYEVYQLIDNIENDIIEGSSWSEKIRLFFVDVGRKVSNVLTYLKKLLTPLFKKKLSKGDWINLFLLTHVELKLADADLVFILKSQVLESDFSIQQKKYFFRNAILFSSKLELNTIMEILLKDEQVLELIALDDFVENLEEYAELNGEEHVRRILSLLSKKTGHDTP